MVIASRSTTLQKLVGSLFGSKLILNHGNFILMFILSVTTISFTLCNDIATVKNHEVAYTLYLTISASSLMIFSTYYSKRSHKNGGLLLPKQLGLWVFVSLFVLAFMTMSIENYDTEKLIPFLLGSILVTAFCGAIAFVADNWYAIGTGQFFMLSLDTIGIFVYFILPVLILLVLFFDKYETSIHTLGTSFAVVFSEVLKKVPASQYMINNDDEESLQLQKYMLIFMTLPTILGLPLIHNLCPINGHLFARIFTNGRPNTKEAAICVSFNDVSWFPIFLQDDKGAAGKEIENNKLLNIFVTLEDLMECESCIKHLKDSGHLIGIQLADTSSLSSASTSIVKTFDLYEKVLGVKPIWWISHEGRQPDCFMSAMKLEMRSVMWSTLLRYKSDSNDTILETDLLTHNGGSIVYWSNGNDHDDSSQYKKDNASESLLKSLDLLDKKDFKCSTLTTMMHDPNQMNL